MGTELESKNDTPEDRLGGQSRRSPTTIITVLVLLLVIAGAISFVCVFLIDQERHRMRPSVARDYSPLDGKEIGRADARVSVVAVVPLKIDCHGTAVEYLEAVAKKHPRLIRVRFVEWFSPEGKEAAESAGRRTSCIIIDGKTRFIDADGQEVRLERDMDIDTYTVNHLRDFLQQRLNEEYGNKAPALMEYRR